jgi:hypothetical protein
MVDFLEACILFTGIFLFIGGIFGLIVIRFLDNGPRSAKKSPATKVILLVSLCCIGVPACLFGLYNLVGDNLSKHSYATGVVTNMYLFHGKGASSHFDVRSSDGSLLHADCDYVGDHLYERESVSVDTLSFDSTLIHLKVLDGPYAGWTLNERNGTLGSFVMVALGSFFLFIAWSNWRKKPEEIDAPLTLPTD